jgi:hypothetical protein
MKSFSCLALLLTLGAACTGTPSGDAGLGNAPSERSATPQTIVIAPSPSSAHSSSRVPESSAEAPTVANSPMRSTLSVKRLVVTSGVKDREPVSIADALPSDGSPIYAFAELANPGGGSENVRITFERKGGAERVGNVTLPVPAKVSRHRTWATTRFIRAPGVWEAVLWNESGGELGRTSFEVGAASS